MRKRVNAFPARESVSAGSGAVESDAVDLLGREAVGTRAVDLTEAVLQEDEDSELSTKVDRGRLGRVDRIATCSRARWRKLRTSAPATAQPVTSAVMKVWVCSVCRYHQCHWSEQLRDAGGRERTCTLVGCKHTASAQISHHLHCSCVVDALVFAPFKSCADAILIALNQH